MTLTAIVGALLAVLPRAKPRLTPVIDPELDRHVIEAQARHIERLERELAMAQQVLEHWRGEAARLARAQQAQRQALLQGIAQARTQAQLQQAQAQQNIAMQQLANLGMQQQNQAQGDFCNCVPSRAQVWGAQHGLVQQLNTFLGD